MGPLYALRMKHAWPGIGPRSHATRPATGCENGRFTPSLARLGIEKTASRGPSLDRGRAHLTRSSARAWDRS
jgi:hypothetical protein